MRKISIAFTLAIILCTSLPAGAQRVLSLDSCRALALRNNKQLNATRLKQDVALNVRKAARTKYLPKVDAVGGYEYFSKEISLLSKDQQSTLNNLGTTMGTTLGSGLTSAITGLVQQGAMSMQTAQELGNLANTMATPLAQAGNALGQTITDAFHTNTHHVFAASVMVRQPIYMGGAITAANRIADINEQLVSNELQGMSQNTIFNIDNTYWTVVSLRQKQKLAQSYYDLVKKLDDDVHKMINEGVATRAEGLKVDVKVNEAEMQVTQVEDGLTLAKMLLCQLCGLPVGENIQLIDENNDNIAVEGLVASDTIDRANVATNRAELRMLQNTIDISKQTTKLTRALYLPQVALTGGYLLSNPNTFNGFQRRFSGVWNVGVMVRVPIWNWFEGEYKVRASKAATLIAEMELSDAKEKIDLQISQSEFKVNEATKKLTMANKNLASAEENLRCANVGFREGVMDATDVMAAQTAWQMAQSQKIDAEIDVKLSQVNLKKALGKLQ